MCKHGPEPMVCILDYDKGFHIWHLMMHYQGTQPAKATVESQTCVMLMRHVCAPELPSHCILSSLALAIY